MLRMCSRGLAIVVLMACIGIGTADAAQQEPAREVSAAIGARFSTPVLAVPCNGSLTRNRFVIDAQGAERDASTPAESGLTGKLQLKLSYVENRHGAVLGHVNAVLTQRHSGEVLYSGGGTFAGRENPPGGIEARGLLDAILYSKGKPTARHLIANIAFGIDSINGTVNGGFGDEAPAEASIAIETTGSTC
jgi:hypothetical protein